MNLNQTLADHFRKVFQIAGSVGLLGLLALGFSGCGSLQSFHGVNAVPASRLPGEFFPPPKSLMVQISMDRLRQRPPEVYQLAPGDVLGIYIENVLGESDVLPPVHYPDDPTRAPVVGFPVPVRENGTIALPFIEPLKVEGLTLVQSTDLIRKAYTLDKQILKEGKDRILVDLIKRRVYRVLVVREESGTTADVTKRGQGFVLDLPAYENDLLHALSETGGLPGIDAENEILIFRGAYDNSMSEDHYVTGLLACDDPCRCRPAIPPPPGTTIVPIRFYPQNAPNLSEKDILLNTGDIILIQTRDDEKFYTGGTLGGGEHLLPRDYDLDVLQAIAVAGGAVGGGGTGIGQIGGGGGGGVGGGRGYGIPPSQLIILRKTCAGQIPIQINVNRALENPAERILVQKEDVLILKYTLCEELANAALSLVQFNFLFNGLSGNGVNRN